MDQPNQRLADTLQQLAQGWASDKASLSTKDLADHLEIHLSPVNPRAAEILLIIPAGQRDDVTIILGKGSIFEVPENGGRYTGHRSVAAEVAAICEAVIAGKFTERVKLDARNEVFSSRGTVDLPPLITARWRQLFYNPFRRTSTRSLSYEPY